MLIIYFNVIPYITLNTTLRKYGLQERIRQNSWPCTVCYRWGCSSAGYYWCLETNEEITNKCYDSSIICIRDMPRRVLMRTSLSNPLCANSYTELKPWINIWRSLSYIQFVRLAALCHYQRKIVCIMHVAFEVRVLDVYLGELRKDDWEGYTLKKIHYRSYHLHFL